MRESLPFLLALHPLLVLLHTQPDDLADECGGQGLVIWEVYGRDGGDVALQRVFDQGHERLAHRMKAQVVLLRRDCHQVPLVFEYRNPITDDLGRVGHDFFYDLSERFERGPLGFRQGCEVGFYSHVTHTSNINQPYSLSSALSPPRSFRFLIIQNPRKLQSGFQPLACILPIAEYTPFLLCEGEDG